MKLLKNKGQIFLIMILLVALLAGCSKGPQLSKQVVVTINDREIFLDEAYLYLQTVEQEYEYLGGADIWETENEGQSMIDMAKETTIERIVHIKMVLNKAEELKFSLTDEEKEELKEEVAAYMDAVPAEEKEKRGITKDLITRVFTETRLVNKVFEEVTKDFEIDEAQIDESVKENPTLLYYASADLEDLLKQVTAKHILIRTFKEDESGSRVNYTEEEKAEALKKANEVLAKAKSGDDFVALVKEYSEDAASVATDGEMTFGRGQMVTEFEDAAFSMAEGEISELVETQFGYHIIKLVKHEVPTEEEINEFKGKLQEYEASLRYQLGEQQKSEAFFKTLEDWKSNYTINVNNEVWDTVQVGSTTTEK